ncbi:hypothetical protein FO519_010545, partial [Halicephalobus sp. NKZ332]
MTNALKTEAEKIGLRINSDKSKIMTINRLTKAKITTDSQTIQEVENFKYLGSFLSKEGGTVEDVKHRLSRATALFQKMRQIWRAKSMNIKIKLRLFNTIILPTATYASETWKFSKKVAQKLDVFQQRCLRKILGISYLSRTTNEEVLNRSNSRSLQEITTDTQKQYWIGSQNTERGKEADQGKLGGKLSRKTYSLSKSPGTKPSPQQLIVKNGNHLLPYVPRTGETD